MVTNTAVCGNVGSMHYIDSMLFLRDAWDVIRHVMFVEYMLSQVSPHGLFSQFDPGLIGTVQQEH